MDIQIEISSDHSFLGDAATGDDVDALRSNVLADLRAAYPDSMVSARVVSVSGAFRVILHGEGVQAEREAEREKIKAIVQDAYGPFA